MDEYREIYDGWYEGIHVGRIGAADVLSLRAMLIRWDEIEELIVVRSIPATDFSPEN